MFASVTFKRALIVGRLVGWLDTSKPHLTPAPWAWREINRLERIMNMRLLHSYAPTSSGGSTIGLSVTDAWDRAAVSVMLARCSRTTAESIRERLDTRRRRQMSKWNPDITPCPLLAQSGHRLMHRTCPLLGVKRTCRFALHMSAYDPKRRLDFTSYWRPICFMKSWLSQNNHS